MDNKDLLLRPAVAIRDPEIEAGFETLCLEGAKSWIEQSSQNFGDEFRSWISPFLEENPLNLQAQSFLTAGTTGSFQDFYQVHQSRRLRILRGEYPFHRDVYESLNLPWKWLQIDDLSPSDVVIMSFPFSGDGGKTPHFIEILEACEKLEVPVLIDCAFAGLSDLVLPAISHYKCVQKVSFSLSKIFNLGSLRCGIEFSSLRKGANSILSSWSYGQKMSAFIGRQMMLKFPSHYLLKKYQAEQYRVCDHFGIKPSATVLFGLGDDRWKEFSRDGHFNRVCLSEVLSENEERRRLNEAHS